MKLLNREKGMVMGLPEVSMLVKRITPGMILGDLKNVDKNRASMVRCLKKTKQQQQQTTVYMLS